jgi:hypothetical protein
MVTSEFIDRFTEVRQPINYYHLIIVSIDAPLGPVLPLDQADAVIETLWHLFKEDLIPIYSLVTGESEDRNGTPAPESLRRCFAEARAMAKVLVAPQRQ